MRLGVGPHSLHAMGMPRQRQHTRAEELGHVPEFAKHVFGEELRSPSRRELEFRELRVRELAAHLRGIELATLHGSDLLRLPLPVPADSVGTIRPRPSNFPPRHTLRGEVVDLTRFQAEFAGEFEAIHSHPPSVSAM